MLWQRWLYFSKVLSFVTKIVVFGQSGCILTKWYYFRQKWLHLGKNGCFLANVVFWEKWLHLGKNDCNPAKRLSLVKSCCTRVKGCIWQKM